MKTGLTLSQMANEIERRINVKEDFIVPTEKLELITPNDFHNDFKIAVPEQGHFGITEFAHKQIANRIGVPTRYYTRMMTEAPELLQTNVNHWFNNQPERRMVRTLDGSARAFLSDSYRRIDNDAVLTAVLPIIHEMTSAHILSCNVTDQKMYLKILFPEIQAEIAPGDVVRLGIIISNGEIGNGSARVQVFFYRDFCTNGCVFGKEQAFDFKRYHIGGKLIEGINHTIISDDTQEKDDQLLIAQMADVVKSATDTALFDKMVTTLRNAAESEKIVNPEAAVEVLAKNVGLNESERAAALINLIEDRDYSKYGALNAVTKIANTHDSYDRASDLEALGGKVLALSQREWHQIATAEAA